MGQRKVSDTIFEKLELKESGSGDCKGNRNIRNTKDSGT